MLRNSVCWAAMAYFWLSMGACSTGGAAPPSVSMGGGTGGTVDYGTGGTVYYGTGGADATGGGTAAATGGQSGRDPTLFAWPEANPDASAPLLCKAGHYVGTYSCNVTGPNGFGADGGIQFPLTGPVDLRLAQSQSGEFLTVSGGTLKSAAGILALDASLDGTLNCQSGAFGGTLLNGTLSIPPFPPGGTFSGDLSATFVSDGPKLVGSWTLVGEGQYAGYSCTGPWTATWQAT